MDLSPTTVLRTNDDVVRLRLSGIDGPIYVLQLGDADQNVLVKQGGELVFRLLELCDGGCRLEDLISVLRSEFDGPESLWTNDLNGASQVLLEWNVLQVVDR